MLLSRRQAVVATVVAAGFALAFAPVPQVQHGHDGDVQAHEHLGERAGGHLGELTRTGPTLFWSTPEATCDRAAGPTSPSAPPSCSPHVVWTWTMDVTGPTDRLRIDFDQPYRQDTFTLEVTGPGTSTTARSGGSLSAGVRVAAPAPGRWTVTLRVERTAGSRVRLRAGLVDDAPFASGAKLPNLEVLPPFEFGFAAPANPTNSVFLAGDDQNPPMHAAGQNLNSCAVDEVHTAADPTQREQPTVLLRCLRFTTGPQNTGAGHFDLRFPILDRARNDRDRLVEMTQFIHHGQPGLTTERPAGTYEYHATHGHYHYRDILYYEAFEVTDPVQGDLRRVGVGTKSGFCPVDQGYGDWFLFDQSVRDAVLAHHNGDCFALTGRGAMGLSAGWGDVYRWQRSGQYIDFTGVGDGTYVVRATVDVLDNVLESDETDNAGYALIEVRGDEVQILERGRGASPFDPDKVIVQDHRDT